MDPSIRHLIGSLHSGKTGYHLGRVLLVIGMPVMITHNFDVQSDVVNGCSGMLTQFIIPLMLRADSMLYSA